MPGLVLAAPGIGCPPRPTRGSPTAAEGSSTLFGATLFGLLTQKASIYGRKLAAPAAAHPTER
jgi:hypothetical protein